MTKNMNSFSTTPGEEVREFHLSDLPTNVLVFVDGMNGSGKTALSLTFVLDALLANQSVTIVTDHLDIVDVLKKIKLFSTMKEYNTTVPVEIIERIVKSDIPDLEEMLDIESANLSIVRPLTLIGNKLTSSLVLFFELSEDSHHSKSKEDLFARNNIIAGKDSILLFDCDYVPYLKENEYIILRVKSTDTEGNISFNLPGEVGVRSNLLYRCSF